VLFPRCFRKEKGEDFRANWTLPRNVLYVMPLPFIHTTVENLWGFLILNVYSVLILRKIRDIFNSLSVLHLLIIFVETDENLIL